MIRTVFALAVLLLCTLSEAADPPVRVVNQSPDQRGIISACSDGDMAMCEQLDLAGGNAITGNKPLDKRAAEFAARSETLSLREQPHPDLNAAYPLIVDDYFAAPTITAAEKEQWYKASSIKHCAWHYDQKWIAERNWWPADSEGNVHWHLVYYHVMDHYFGYCIRYASGRRGR